MGNVSNTLCRENQQQTNFLYSITFFVNQAFCKITWKNNVQPDRPQMTMWHMRIACWITKIISSQSEYVTLIAFTNATMIPRKQMDFRFIRILLL